MAFLQMMRTADLIGEKENLAKQTVDAHDEAILAEFFARHGIAREGPDAEDSSSGETDSSSHGGVKSEGGGHQRPLLTEPALEFSLDAR